MRPTWRTVMIACLLTQWSDAADVRQQPGDVVQQPRIITQDGHLVFQTAENHNISFKSSSGGFINIDGLDVGSVVQTARANQQRIDEVQTSVMERVSVIEQSLSALDTRSQIKMNAIELLLNTTADAGGGRTPRQVIDALQNRVSALETQVATINTGLAFDNCASNPCSNGGSCVDMYNTYRCFCPPNWQGARCDVDVNECSFYQGSSLGCDKGQCRNVPGGFTCICNQGYMGVLCNIPAAGGRCSAASSSDLCGHGTCVDQQASFACLCDEGWTRDSSTPPKCVMDKDECAEGQRCYSGVQCINFPGGFHCGPCPRGFSGNGRTCTDINECEVANGGCSTNPVVECTNTIGSSTCGPCPRGYNGNGRICVWVGVCNLDRGGCSPDADCLEHPALPNRRCQCRPGFSGSGEGPYGCVSNGGTVGTSCTPNPCIRGTCELNSASQGGGYVCSCPAGYMGPRCEGDIDECSVASTPCLNQGTCINTVGGYMCSCTPSYTGSRCEASTFTCGGQFSTDGNFSFPDLQGFPYPPDLSCAWVISTDQSKVLEVRFPSFHLEDHARCDYDFLQIHDGNSASAHMIGKFCGASPPLSFNSTHNSLYLWFRSDSSDNRDGFTISWRSVPPSCGGDIRNQTYGAITSPGYPGQYPINRVCIWTIVTTPGYDIYFTFGHLAMESHPNCSFDYLEVRNGLREDGRLLNRFCSSTDPQPFSTSGNEAILKFRSDSSLSDTGFLISWSSIRAGTTCGGIYHQDSGAITSPGYPEQYPDNRDCIYVISISDGNRVQLSFTNMDLESAPLCSKDYLEVRSGNDQRGALFGTYCGRQLPPPLISSTKFMYLNFHSDSAVRGTGFRAIWSPVCGGIFSGPGGEISSPGFPDSGYPAGTSCDYTITTIADFVIQFTFESLENIPCPTDYIEVRDGVSAEAPLIGRYCSSNLPQQQITSSSNSLLIRFRGATASAGSGFLARYVARPIAIGGGGNTDGSSCGGLVTGQNGVITSPGHPNYYPHGARCRWDIQVEPGFQIRLMFVFFSLESGSSCEYDYVAVYDNSTRGPGLLGRYCGSSAPPALTSMDNTLSIIFQADGSLAHEGFSATYLAMNVSYCQYEIRVLPAVISSPNYPGPYPNNRECLWIISAPENHQVSLNVTDFEMEAHQNCQYDYLEIRNGGYSTSPLIGLFCGASGSTVPPSIMVSHGSSMYLRFKTDNSDSARGFRIVVEDVGEGCGADLTSPSGSFTSPNYPAAYGHNAECYWTITVAQGSIINLIFLDMQVEEHAQCLFDYVEVLDGRHTGRRLGRYCGSTLPQIQQSTRNQLSVKFRTDSSATGRGFHAVYSTSCSNRMLTGSSGVIESPNFPNPYPFNRDCSWVIGTTRGNTLNASFSHFSIEHEETCAHDRVEVRDGQAADSALIGTYCGTQELPPLIVSTGQYLYVKFVSDSSLAYNGFRLEWIANGCGRHFTSSMGSFTSPGYPDHYPHQQECVWTISTPDAASSSIELTVQGFDLESHSNCAFDVLEVYGGADATAPRLAQLCSQHPQPLVVTSTSNEMYIRFATDASNNGRGFNAMYRSVSGGCGGSLSTPNGVIVSKNYPNVYPHNTNCIWNITVAPQQTVVFQFMEFDVESSPDCQYDYVAVYDGLLADSPLLLKTCGSSLPNTTVIVSSSNTMRVRMRTDSSRSGRGFKANYTTGCGGYRNADQDGSIISPNYPSTYPSNVNCTWIIAGSQAADRLTIQFTHMDLEDASGCQHDGVQVLQGDNVDAPRYDVYCGTRLPPAITSLGNALVVQFYSDSSVQQSGFRLAYSKSTSFCGGVLTAQSGAFNSPSYPDSYPAMTECVWTLNTSPGNGMMLSFTMFDLQPDADCNLDYVEIRDGGNLGRFLGRFCGSSRPSNATYGHSLWVKFRSDESTSGRGFMAQFAMANRGTLTGPTGSLASPLYPGQYPHDVEYTWTITVSAGASIRITFVELDMESGHIGCLLDYVKFYDGADQTASVLGSYCGRQKPPSFTSSTNILTVVFHTDGSSNGRGFLLTWQEMLVSVRPLTPSATPNATCGGQLVATKQEQNLTSPNYPSSYPHNLQCLWTIISAEASRVSFSVDDMIIEYHRTCSFDAVEVYSGNSPTPTSLLGKFCGRVRNSTVRSSRSNVMTVRFTTDGSSSHMGFRASYKQVCGGYVNSRVGVITSPGFPNNTDTNANCTWVVEVSNGRTIDVTLETFEILSSTDCSADYLLLRNGGNSMAPPLGTSTSGRYCGDSSPGQLSTSSNFLYIQFASGSTSYRGFKLTYRERQVSCGDTLYLTNEAPQGVFTSPNYPQNYPHNVECEWVITAPVSKQIQVDFDSQFEIESHVECIYDFLELRDGGTEYSPSLGRFCGSAFPGTQRSSGNVMYIRFRTDDSVPRKGFRATYKISTCGGTLVGLSGELASPNFPQNAPTNVECNWFISGPPGHYLTFTFDTFSLPLTPNCTGGDYVEIQDRNATGQSVGRVGPLLCGPVLPQAVTTSDSLATVRFYSDGLASGSQIFRARFEASVEECGGDLITPSGTFSSPNFPGQYPHNRVCTWRITVPLGRRVTLVFNELDIESHASCIYDYVELHNGHLASSPRLGRYCSSASLPSTPLQSSSNTMKVTFVTDGSVTNRGFRASYSSEEDAECGGELTGNVGATGTIDLTTVNGTYAHKQECIWIIRNQQLLSSSIVARFPRFNLEDDGQCRFDFVEMREGSSSAGPLIGRFCGNTTINRPPPTITSPYPAMWIVFSSDSSLAGDGFQMTYAFTRCGGVLTGAAGVITSPNFPSNYNHDDDCSWEIVVPQGLQIELSFTHFAIEYHDKCKFDWVAIYNGGSPGSPLARTICGTDPQGPFVSQSNKVRVEFHSDVNSAAGGFRLVYSARQSGCGGSFHSNSGQLASPNWPRRYHNNVECLWDISVMPGYHVKLIFDPLFDVATVGGQCGRDYVTVADVVTRDENVTEVQLGRHCGQQQPPQRVSTGNRMLVKFHSEAGSGGGGFAANWTSGCGAVFSDRSGSIVSPGFPQNYESNLTCEWTILADNEQFIMLQFDPVFRLEGATGCRYDYVQIFEGNSSRPPARSLGRFCGAIAPQPVASRGSMTLQFVTDRDTTDKGWTARFSITECGGSFTGEYGMITSPTRPLEYFHNLNCTWTITVPANRSVQLRFNSFDLEQHTSCRYDYVELRDGPSRDSPLIGRYCGGVMPPPVTTLGEVLTVAFVTDSSISKEGFVASYQAVLGERQGCGGTIVGNSRGVIRPPASPNHPSEYAVDVDCVWTVIVDGNKNLRLNVSNLDMEDSASCRFDYLEIRDGQSPDSPVDAKLCGNSNGIQTFVASSNVMRVRFFSDDSATGTGFVINFDSVDPVCGGQFNATSAPTVVSSPGYPLLPPSSMRCRWIIAAPRGENVRIAIRALSLPYTDDCRQHFFQMADPRGTGESAPLQDLSYCGNEIPPAFDSANDVAVVNFVTAGNVLGSVYRGAQFSYTIASCNRNYTDDNGRIYSPRWPNNYGTNMSCDIMIRTNIGTRISLFFNLMSIEFNWQCAYDYLLVWDGSSRNATRLCGFRLPAPYFATGNVVYMKFVTDDSTTSRGFDITYTSSSSVCGGNLTGSQGSFTSPAFPRPYPANTTCVWQIRTPRRSQAVLQFDGMDIIQSTSCALGYVEVRQGDSESGLLVGRYCGGEKPANFTASANTIYVKFLSGAQAMGTGFRATYMVRGSSIIGSQPFRTRRPPFGLWPIRGRQDVVQPQQ